MTVLEVTMVPQTAIENLKKHKNTCEGNSCVHKIRATTRLAKYGTE